MALHLLSSLPVGGIQSSIGEATLYALIGFLTVIAGIAFLVFVVWLVGKIISKFSIKNGKKTEKTEKTKKTEEKPSVVSMDSEEGISEETIAVIMAALTAYYQTNQPKCEFTVKRIKRI